MKNIKSKIVIGSILSSACFSLYAGFNDSTNLQECNYDSSKGGYECADSFDTMHLTNYASSSINGDTMIGIGDELNLYKKIDGQWYYKNQIRTDIHDSNEEPTDIDFNGEKAFVLTNSEHDNYNLDVYRPSDTTMTREWTYEGTWSYHGGSGEGRQVSFLPNGDGAVATAHGIDLFRSGVFDKSYMDQGHELTDTYGVKYVSTNPLVFYATTAQHLWLCTEDKCTSLDPYGNKAGKIYFDDKGNGIELSENDDGYYQHLDFYKNNVWAGKQDTPDVGPISSIAFDGSQNNLVINSGTHNDG